MMNEDNGQMRLEFFRVKQWGRAVSRTTETTIIVDEACLKFQQSDKKIFRAEKTIEKEIPLHTIQSISIKQDWAIWDTILGIAFGILGLASPILFIGTAVCLYCAYGKKIEIKTIDGSAYEIPIKTKNEDADKLLALKPVM